MMDTMEDVLDDIYEKDPMLYNYIISEMNSQPDEVTSISQNPKFGRFYKPKQENRKEIASFPRAKRAYG